MFRLIFSDKTILEYFKLIKNNINNIHCLVTAKYVIRNAKYLWGN